MKNTSKLMYRIGNIFNICWFALGALLAIIGTIVIIVGAVGGDGAVISSGVSTLITGLIFAVGAVLAWIFVGKAQKELADESTRNNKPFIITIVFGAIAENIFYILAGIFGLIAEGQQGKEQPKEEPKEEKAEEPKAE